MIVLYAMGCAGSQITGAAPLLAVPNGSTPCELYAPGAQLVDGSVVEEVLPGAVRRTVPFDNAEGQREEVTPCAP